MNIRKIFILAATAIICTQAFAQNGNDDDFGIDIGIEAEKRIATNLDFSIDAGFRTQDNTQKVERYSVGAGLSYKFISTKKFDMKVNGGFEYLWCQKLGYKKDHYNSEGEYNGYNIYDSYWRNRHRTQLGLSASYSPSKRWSFSLKETVQYNHFCSDSVRRQQYRYNDDDEEYLKSDENKYEKSKDRFVLRSKLTIEYNIKGLPLNPFVSVDYGCGLNYTANKWKLSIGSDYNINKKNKLSLFYRFQTEDDDDEPNGHIVGLAYKIKL